MGRVVSVRSVGAAGDQFVIFFFVFLRFFFLGSYYDKAVHESIEDDNKRRVRVFCLELPVRNIYDDR